MGGSFVASPEGSLILDAGVEPGLYLVDLDLSWIAKVRARWGFLEEVQRERLSLLRRCYAPLSRHGRWSGVSQPAGNT